jgi:methylase of polypeptide subunit release factors
MRFMRHASYSTAASWLKHACSTLSLSTASIDCPQREAWLLYQLVANGRVGQLSRENLSAGQTQKLNALLCRRCHGEPYAYLAGQREFDLGTGSGCLLLTLLHHYTQAIGTGVDQSEPAVRTATLNASRLSVGSGRGTFVHTCWQHFFSQQKFDVVISNPPYLTTDEVMTSPALRFEPYEALDGGPDGLASYRSLCKHLSGWIKPTGHLVLEIGSNMREPIVALFGTNGYSLVDTRKDHGGHDRCLVFQVDKERVNVPEPT